MIKKIMTKNKTRIILLSVLVFIFFVPITVFAQSNWLYCDEGIQGSAWLHQIGIPHGLLIPCNCIDSKPDHRLENGASTCDASGGCSSCGLTEAFQVIINFSNLILALTGSAALLMFTIGGVMFIISSGNQEQVQKGKAAIQAAVIGIVIVLGAWLLVNTIIGALTRGEVGGGPFGLFGREDEEWAQEPTVETSSKEIDPKTIK